MNTSSSEIHAATKRWRPWLDQENTRLINLVEKHGRSWTQIAKSMQGRTGRQCRRHYDYLFFESKKNIRFAKSNWVEREWTKDECQSLANTVELVGTQWSKVAKQMPGRNAMECCERYSGVGPSFFSFDLSEQDDWSEEMNCSEEECGGHFNDLRQKAAMKEDRIKPRTPEKKELWQELVDQAYAQALRRNS